MLVSKLASAGFIEGDLFISSSVTDEVRIYASDTLAFKSSFTDPSFAIPGFPSYARGPNGLAFNSAGNLVVAAFEQFVEFSSPGIAVATYPKLSVEANETLIFDRNGNLYTTTSTGGSDQLNQYRESDYAFVQTISLPPGSGELTGITFDSEDRLYVASQSDAKVYVLQASSDFSTFTFSHSIDSAQSARLEGIQINQNGELIVAAGDIGRYDRLTGVPLGIFDVVPDTNAFPVPLTVDNLGNIFTADFENGIGTLPADLIRFNADGTTWVTVNDPDLFGPFGLAIAGTALPGGPGPTPGPMPVPGTLWLSALTLFALASVTRRNRIHQCSKQVL